MNAKITIFTQAVNFVGNNQIITASCIQKISTCVTMNELSTNNGLNYMLKKENGNSFPKLYLNIMRKTLHFYFSHVSELNFS